MMFQIWNRTSEDLDMEIENEFIDIEIYRECQRSDIEQRSIETQNYVKVRDRY